MPRTAGAVPPPLELLCLRALWRLREGNVKAVQQAVAESRPLAYTTIMTVLDRLVRKGMLARRKVGRSYAYTPQGTLEAARRAALRELLDGYFDGSERALRDFLEGRSTESAPSAAGRTAERIDTVLL